MSVSTQPIFDDLELLAQVSQLWTEVDLNYVLKQVVKLAAKSVGAARASLFLLNSDTLQLSNFIVGAEDFLPEESDDVLQQVIEHGLAGWVLRNGRGVIIENTAKDERWYQMPGMIHQGGSALCIPFMYRSELLGVITLVHDRTNFFTEYHLRLMTVITNQVALAVHNTQAFHQAQQHRAQLQTILQAIPDILLVLDENERVVIASNAASTLLSGAEASTILEVPLAALAGMDTLFTQIHEGLEMTERQSGDWSFEARSEKTERDFLVHILSRQRFSQEAGYIIVMNEVTALRNLSRFKDAMLHLVSHDMRTPLIVITGYADLLEMDLAHKPKQLEMIRGILEASDRMDKMLTNMLRVEKLRSTPAELHEAVNLKLLVAALLHDLYPLAERKDIQMNLEITGDPIPTIQGDTMLLRQAMENFVSNAIKYTQRGGEVLVQAYIHEQRFYFVVKDTGIGIPTKDLPFVFESYYRGNNADTQSTSGIGLGLSLVKNVIAQHHGSIWVDSEENRGSTFGFWLPLK